MAAIYGAALHGGEARLVRVEAVLGRGLSRITLVGMPDQPTREARERLPSAFSSHGFPFHRGHVLFNLVPAQFPKGGMPLDLALAASLLIAQRVLEAPHRPWLLLAELDLDGRLAPPARGTLLAALAVGKAFGGVLTAPEAAPEAALAPHTRAYAAQDLEEAVEILRTPERCQPARPCSPPPSAPRSPRRLEDVHGQEEARRAAILAAAGRHPLLLQGPPGTGKSLLARRVVDLLPPLNPGEALEVARIEASLGRVRALPTRPPFRAPHTSVSAQALLGGGRPLRPGELSRAHHGVLFLDELPEFARPVLEGLRQPLEEGEIRLQRAREWAVFPAAVLLVAARNPCPCGFLTHRSIPCTCSPARIENYRLRTSGPLLDRFDLFVEMGPVSPEALSGPPTPPGDREARAALATAAAVQEARRARGGFGPAGRADMNDLKEAGIHPAAQCLLDRASEILGLSGRGHLRCLRVARSAADLRGSPCIEEQDLRTALNYRRLDATGEAARG